MSTQATTARDEPHEAGRRRGVELPTPRDPGVASRHPREVLRADHVGSMLRSTAVARYASLRRSDLTDAHSPGKDFRPK